MNGRDENDMAGGPRITRKHDFRCLQLKLFARLRQEVNDSCNIIAADMVQVMRECFAHNEIRNSGDLLARYQAGELSFDEYKV
jgi:hypothetical protein